jgi:hypothetical protein
MINADTATAEDIRRLVDSKRSESSELDYKQELPGNKDEDRKEFLADVSAFANSQGGLLVYGISEERDVNGKCTGLPKEVAGLAGINPELERSRLENMIADGISPRIVGMKVRFIREVEPGKGVLLVQVPRSWSSPHMVTSRRSSRFYGRNSGGKYQLDVTELRNAFASGESGDERAARFRLDRISKVLSGDTPVALLSNQRLIIHVVPLAGVDDGYSDRLRTSADALQSLPPFTKRGSWGGFWNFDGYCVADTDSAGSIAYVQYFKHGAVESVDCALIRDETVRLMLSQRRSTTLPSVSLEIEIVRQVKRCLQALESLSATGPFGILISLHGVRGFTMAVDRERAPFVQGGREIDRDDLVIPSLRIESSTVDIALSMRPVFDNIWQAAGWPGSLNYSPDGNWRLRP